MLGKCWAHISIATCLGSAVIFAEDDAVAPPSLEIVVSVAEQKLALVKDGGLVRKYSISTSKFGLGDSNGSYKTPLGRLRVCDKFGDRLAEGAVLKSRNATGEILKVNAPGRDPIVTRILWLDGLEPSNRNARDRGIYIHGTPEESRLGQPVSYGCIRMRSRDVVDLFSETPVGTPVEIISERLPRFRRVDPHREILVASGDRVRSLFATNGKASEKPAHGTDLPEPKISEAAKTTPDSMPEKSSEQTPKPSAAPSRLAAAASESPTVELPNVVLKTAPPRPPEPNVVLAMKKSILDSGLPEEPRRAVRLAFRATAEPPDTDM